MVHLWSYFKLTKKLFSKLLNLQLLFKKSTKHNEIVSMKWLLIALYANRETSQGNIISYLTCLFNSGALSIQFLFLCKFYLISGLNKFDELVIASNGFTTLMLCGSCVLIDVTAAQRNIHQNKKSCRCPPPSQVTQSRQPHVTREENLLWPASSHDFIGVQNSREVSSNQQWTNSFCGRC